MASPTLSITQSTTIDAPPEEVFAVLIDPATVADRSRDTRDVHVDTTRPLQLGSQFRRTLYSHGLPNRRVVTVVVFEAPRQLVTRTTLLGYTVEYGYQLASAGEDRTRLTLTKSATGGWPILRPLIAHLLSRPEHDADHLDRIRTLVASGRVSQVRLFDRA